MQKIIHMVNPLGMDTSLCGDADEIAHDVEQYQSLPEYGDVVTCKRCLTIIDACVKQHAAQQARAGGRKASKRTSKK